MISKAKLIKYSVIVGFIILLLYNFHRYIFMYNSEGTSPTYANTPATWKSGKYLAILLVLCVFYLGSTFKLRAKRVFVFIYAMVFYVLVINIFNYFIYDQFNTEEISYCYWFILLIPYCFTENNLENFNVRYKKLIYLGAYVLFISNFVAIGNYLMFHRLPALAYDQGLIRFGGFWDDPNAFAIINVFLFYYLFNDKKYLLCAICVLNIVLAFSFTAYFLFLFSIVYWAFPTFWIVNKKYILVAFGIAAAIALVVFYNMDTLQTLYNAKADSIDAHLNNVIIFNYWPLQNTYIQFSENWMESSFYNYFPVSIIFDLFVLIFFLSLFMNAKYRYTKFYFFLFIAGAFFFSTLYIFPLNFTFIFLLVDYIKTGKARIDHIPRLTAPA